MTRALTDYNKVAIIGAGKVGMTAAYALLLDGYCHEIVLYGRDKNKLIGEQLDLEHAAAIAGGVKITITDNPAELTEVDIFVFSAGAPQAPGESRLELAAKNLAIVDELVPQLLAASPKALVLMVANPVDLMTYRAQQITHARSGQIFGSGTLLDTARFRFHLSQFLPVNPQSIHAYVLGEHGDHSFPVISSATIGGQKLTAFPGFSSERALAAYDQARDAAYQIIDSKGATYYGISASITRIVRTILRRAQTVLPLSVPLTDYYGESDIAMSVPGVIGREGVSQIITIQLDDQEQAQFHEAAAALRQVSVV